MRLLPASNPRDGLRSGARAAYTGGEYSRRRTLHAVLSAATRTRFSHAVIELRLQDGHGIALIERLRARHPPMRMVVITGFDSFASVIVALRRRERLSAQADRRGRADGRSARPGEDVAIRARDAARGRPRPLGAHHAGARTVRLQRERDGTPPGHASAFAAADLEQAGAATAADVAAMIVPRFATVACGGRGTGSMTLLVRGSIAWLGYRRPPRQACARPAGWPATGSTTVPDDSAMTGWRRKHPPVTIAFVQEAGVR
jgi:hypothetical protein